MATELRQLPLSTVEDILLAHEWAMYLAKRAGVDPTEQLGFAASVAETCRVGDHVIFSIEKTSEDDYLLKATTKEFPAAIEKKVPLNIGHIDLLAFHDTNKKNWEELERNYRDMQDFTLALSHDLKNSLAKLKLAVSLVEEEEMPPAVQNYMQIIHRASSRLERTMKSLNQIIKFGHTAPDTIRKIQPAVIFEDVREEFTETLYAMNATLSVNFSDAKEISYIETYLRSIFSNTISNAIKYADPVRPLHLLIHAYKTESWIILTITDNGQGIDLHEHGDEIFLPFKRFSEQGDGTGIGLYLIKHMVERNGGRIEVDSIPGAGTTFSFFLREY